jgi:hypothetical protein
MPRWRMRIITPAAVVRLSVLATFLAVLGALGYWTMVSMPGRSWHRALPPLSVPQTALRDRLLHGVQHLAGDIGERNIDNYEALQAATDWLDSSLAGAGYRVERQPYEAFGRKCDNLVVERRGTALPGEIVVIGAHYDSVAGSPGANDNATGAVAVLELARAFSEASPARTLRFVEFVNEEPPYFLEDTMGSRVYAKRCRARGERIVAMLSVETVGYFTRGNGSQKYPMPVIGLVYPTTGDFISFVGNLASRNLVRHAVGSFRTHASFPSEGGAFPSSVPGVGWSDHSSFWEVGYPAVMVTDTAPFRYPHYHKRSDTPDEVDFDALARVVDGLEGVVGDLGGG